MLLKQYKERFSGSPVQATWTYLRQTALDALPPNPLVSHDTEARHLRDPAFLVRMMRCAPVRLPPPVCVCEQGAVVEPMQARLFSSSCCCPACADLGDCGGCSLHSCPSWWRAHVAPHGAAGGVGSLVCVGSCVAQPWVAHTALGHVHAEAGADSQPPKWPVCLERNWLTVGLGSFIPA